MSEVFSLSQAEVNRPLKVVRIATDKQDVALRLKELNVRRGSKIKIFELNKNAPLMLAIGDARVAIDYELSHSIMVCNQYGN